MAGTMKDHGLAQWQKCFRIPRESLGSFIDQVQKSKSTYSFFVVEHIISAGAFLDVVVSEYGGTYPFVEDELERFVDLLFEREINSLGRKFGVKDES